MTIRERVIQKARELISSDEKGVRYSNLARRLKEELPDINLNTIHGTIWNLESRLPQEIYKPARGVFRHIKFKETEPTGVTTAPEPLAEKIAEEQFYEPFADWLINELEECTRAISLGGNIFRDKWGTPDIVGIRKPRESDIIKPPIEILSAEVKLDTSGLITAFGQACSYKLFSHKSYIVIPSQSSEDDIARLDALGRIFGIGVILFDSTNPGQPNFEIRVRASRLEPDMFYVNKYLKIIEDELFP
jgi:hypothetical protein